MYFNRVPGFHPGLSNVIPLGYLPVNHVDEGFGEGGEVFGGAAGDLVAVDDDGFVEPFGAGVGHVVFDADGAGGFFAFEDAGGDEDPSGVADVGDGLAGGVEFADEVEDFGIAAEFVGREATGHEEGVVVVGGDVGDGGVADTGVAVLAFVELFAFGGGDDYIPAFFFEADFGVPEFEVLVYVVDDGENVFHGVLLWVFT